MNTGDTKYREMIDILGWVYVQEERETTRILQ